MDFYRIKERSIKRGITEVYVDFRVCRSKDLMVRGKSFYAIWDEGRQLWSTDEYDVQRLIDEDLTKYADKLREKTTDIVIVRYMSEFSSGAWVEFRRFLQNISDSSRQLDETITFSNTEVKKEDYISKRLNYPLEKGEIKAYDEIIGTLYEPDERAKLEWAIGSIVAGDAKNIQKFIVLYGESGAGKSTILNIIQKLFEGYYTSFDAKALTSSSNAFSTEAFKSNPLVAIQHDGDLSKIEDNTKLNSIVSHEEITINEKFKPSYMSRINSFLFMGTNKPVKITDAKSGIIRRLIDVKPSGNRIPNKRYNTLMQQIDFELGAIAYHCLEVYRKMGKNYYSGYKPLEMMYTTDVFFNFVEAYYHEFKETGYVTLSRAYEMYKTYCDEGLIEYKLAKYKFREELKNYFDEYHKMKRIDGEPKRNVYVGFLTDKFTNSQVVDDSIPNSLVIDSEESLFDKVAENYTAQYATQAGTPSRKWDQVKTKLKDLDTSRLHYVRLPLNHIVIDFDLKNDEGEKDLEKNLEAASKWPPTYSELSKSGKGIHLHYIYDGDPEQLSRIYDTDIEVKVFVGNSSLRRKLIRCNNTPIATINSGLPLKGAKMINFEAVKSEQSLRNLIKRNLNKEIHPGTKPSIDFIHKILEDAYHSELVYDLTDLRPAVLAFANNSTNQAEYCVKLVAQMKFKSEVESQPGGGADPDELVFFDLEVFPNLFTIGWKYAGEDNQVVRMINPTAEEVAELLKMNLVGFNCRRYDNHILYARYIGYNNEQLFQLSQKIIAGSQNAFFREAYNISYTDVYDFSSVKQSLKKWEIELGINHHELGIPWDEPVPEDKWHLVAEYQDSDVIATEAVFNARKQDFVARQILADISGLTVNDTTQRHTERIIFGKDNRPQDKFVYTDLSETFPGYKFELGKSSYRGEDPKEGGYVYAEPGIWEDVIVLDVASMHPTSLIELNAFGPYTQRFKELVDARLAIKHKEFDKAKEMLGGILAKYLDNEEDSDDLSYALKIVINIVYGMTSAKFDNKFKDPRNIDNIVAKRGSLFMIDLKNYLQDMGIPVVHIKTDSIKIPMSKLDADIESIVKKVTDFGKRYGYDFEYETKYEKFCLVNDAVYIAKIGWSHNGKGIGTWEAVGAQFAQPYVYKTLFSGEPIEFEDLCETKTVQTALYLDFNEGLEEGEHDYHFVGKAGQFTPVKSGAGGGLLMREKDGKYYAASGTKGFRWMESHMVKELNKEDEIDYGYYDKLVESAKKTIEKYGSYDYLVGNTPF